MSQSYRFTAPPAEVRKERAAALGLKDYKAYVFLDDIELAISVARATHRPLLLRGTPGCGKSTLARDIALSLDYCYYETVLSSRTAARDLLWRFDAVRRLGDASFKPRRAAVLHHYVEPSVLFWAFDPELAATRGAGPQAEALNIERLTNPGWGQAPSTSGAVVLLDEIDKADPDVPNDLLVPLGDNTFRIEELDVKVERKRDLFMVITTNEERELPPAFLRRCVVVVLDRPREDALTRIAQEHFPGMDKDLILAVEKEANRYAKETVKVPGARKPGTAEILDALRACDEYRVKSAEDPLWVKLTRLTLWKYERGAGVA